MKIIVTGGSGFIGSAIVWRLNELGREDIVVVDRKDDAAKEKNLAPLKFADFIDADDFIARLDDFRETDSIIHMGACSSTTETNREYMMRNNYQYTKGPGGVCGGVTGFALFMHRRRRRMATARREWLTALTNSTNFAR